VADVLFGDYNPAGRLPVTFYKSVDQLPPFTDYSMKGRTYRYFTGEPLYSFGFGLYTTFAYRKLTLPKKTTPDAPVVISVDVENTGAIAGEEVVELYLKGEGASWPRPIRSLGGFQRIALGSGETKAVQFTLQPRQLAGSQTFEVSVGGMQPGPATAGVVTGTLRMPPVRK
jgi:beta-glucosidase